MKTSLQKILRKVQSVQVGLLRVEQTNGKILLQARAGANPEGLSCILEKKDETNSLLSRTVSLIQKDKEDYLYVSCRVKEETSNNAAIIISMEVLKACWFTRRTRGSVTWLQQKYSYEAIPFSYDVAVS